MVKTNSTPLRRKEKNQWARAGGNLRHSAWKKRTGMLVKNVFLFVEAIKQETEDTGLQEKVKES